MATVTKSQFIGRGESTVGSILGTLFGKMNIIPQYPFEKLVLWEDFQWYDKEVRQHNFDFYVGRYRKPDLIVEVNYKHGAKADHKWNKVFTPIIQEKKMIPVAIEDRECPHLFKDTQHKIDLEDWSEIISELRRNGVKL